MTVSSVKNLNGETFSAVQDASLTDIVSSNSANWNEISAYQANSASYLQDTDLTIVDNKITEISGVPISAGGGEVPEGVMAESGLEFNEDNEISGYNGSAFAAGGYTPSNVFILSAGSGVEITDDQVNKVTTIAVTSQAGNPDVEAYVQNTSADIDATIINVSSNSGVWGGSALQISAGPGIKLEMVDDTLVFSNDETVLYEGELSGNGATAQLSEPIQNFERIKVYGHTDDGIQYPWFTEFYPIENTLMEFGVASNNAGWGKWFYFSITTGGLYTNVTGRVLTFGTTTWGNLDFYGTTKVIGINRISGGE